MQNGGQGSMAQKTKQTPMMEQYLTIKEDYSDAFLFYRLGDFYELFFDDAVTVAHLLELTLTSRNKNADKQIPMCGVPYHSAQNHINSLIEMGYKVAICEQVEDPQKTKGMVKREVVQVVTPGTVMDGNAVDAKKNTYLGSIIEKNGEYTLAYADLSTGELNVTAIDSIEKALNELISLDIKEVVFLQGESLELQNQLEKRLGTVITLRSETKEKLNFDTIKQEVDNKDLLPVLDLLLTYLSETQMRSLDHLQPAQEYNVEQFLVYGQEARKNLELTSSLRDGTKKGTLLWLLDETKTAMGGRMLRSWLEKPLIEKRRIEARQQIVGNLMNHFFERSDMVELLDSVYDLERLAGRVAYGSVNAKDLVQLKQSLTQIPKLKEIIEFMNDDDVWNETLEQLDPIAEVSSLIHASIQDDPPISVTEGEIIKEGFHSQLDEYLDAMKNGKQWIASLEASEREKTGIKNLKVGFNKVFGYYIEITKANLSKLDDERYNRKQTLTNAERFITPELKEKESLILEAEEKSKALEYDLFIEVREQVKEHIERIQNLAKTVAQIDVLQSFAQISEEYNYVRPSFNNESQNIYIENGRHPVVEKVMSENSYVPNDVDLRGDNEILLITGPNMSGKSTYMRQLALSVIMGQMGCYIPGTKAELPIFDQIFTRIGAMDDLIGGQSTFMVEMSETNNALQHATSKSLLLFDEIGRGTATYDGMALAEAIIEFVHDEIGAKTLFSTHYHELTALEERLPKLSNIHVGAEEEEGNLVFLHKMMPGPADKSYGVQVARLAHLPESLLDRASQILEALEKKEEHIFKESFEKQQTVQEDTNEFNDENSQLDLFSTSVSPEEEDVIKNVKKVNIMDMSPLEAINFLNGLQNKLNN